jgi:hypothetical protein
VVHGLKQTAGLCRQLGATPLPPAVLERARASVRRLLEERTDADAGVIARTMRELARYARTDDAGRREAALVGEGLDSHPVHDGQCRQTCRCGATCRTF